MGIIEESPGPMAKCQYCEQTVFGSGAWHERCRIQALERELAAAQTKLARFEQAKLPDGENVCSDCGNRIGNLVCDTCKMTWIEALRACLAAQTVRAEENERDAALGKILMKYIDRLTDATDEDTFQKIVSELGAEVDAAIKEQT